MLSPINKQQKQHLLPHVSLCALERAMMQMMQSQTRRISYWQEGSFAAPELRPEAGSFMGSYQTTSGQGLTGWWLGQAPSQALREKRPERRTSSLLSEVDLGAHPESRTHLARWSHST
mmetsp:Transcript_28367/g.42879  ORF Transcript_28367/g.42879 Transcript_28367/m.42879 type:complete len:118 (-) Transcript_28367:637-990(-)